MTSYDKDKIRGMRLSSIDYGQISKETGYSKIQSNHFAAEVTYKLMKKRRFIQNIRTAAAFYGSKVWNPIKKCETM